MKERSLLYRTFAVVPSKNHSHWNNWCGHLKCEKFGITGFAGIVNILPLLLWEIIVTYCGEKLLWGCRSPLKIVPMPDLSIFFFFNIYSAYVQPSFLHWRLWITDVTSLSLLTSLSYNWTLLLVRSQQCCLYTASHLSTNIEFLPSKN